MEGNKQGTADPGDLMCCLSLQLAVDYVKLYGNKEDRKDMATLETLARRAFVRSGHRKRRAGEEHIQPLPEFMPSLD